MKQSKLVRAGAAALALCLSFLSLTGFARSGFEGEPLQDVPLTLGESSEPEPPPTPDCVCSTKCSKKNQNKDCPVCVLDFQNCEGKELEPAPFCNCDIQCRIGIVKQDCPLCILNLSDCTGKKQEKSQYTISILPPSGWRTQTADIEIRVEDDNGNGFAKVEAKIEKGGKWVDITDDIRESGNAFLEISENSTVYVTVTDQDENTTVKSRYLECFDREIPTVRAELSGELLRIEANDTLSGVDLVYINGTSLSGFTNGTIDIRLRDVVDSTFSQIEILAVDFAGNKSKMLTLKNPLYQTEKKEEAKKDEVKKETPKEETQPEKKQEAEEAPVCPKVEETKTQPEGETKLTATPSPSFSSQVSRPSSNAAPTPTPSTSTTPTAGTGTVIENSEKAPSQREFFTIETAAGNIFYIVVDKEKQSENVYLLTAATETELQALAEKSSGKTEEHVIPDPEPLPEPEPKPEPVPEPTPEPEPTPKPKKDHSALLLVLIIAGGLGAGYYFKVYKPKQDLDDADDWDDMEFENEPTINEDIPALEGGIEQPDTEPEHSDNDTREDD